ncbi:hypothetical protein BMS3Bbin10_01911 [bacterium BMS3Bbin10]|nr:hypothetical protein BMS3Bbin10_01911 [bacterium BMS3Bbin10]
MIFDMIGLAGVAAIIAAFFLLQADRVRYDDYSYLALNGVGAALIIVSLFYAFNLAAFVMETIWVAISVYGAVKRWRRERSG